MPFFSVIIPIYKAEAYLRECIDSVLCQTFQDFELILVDDGSPDGCPAICEEYADLDTHVRVIHKKNGGVAAARNDGLEASNGEVILFLDSDDYWNKENMLAMIYEMYQTEPGIDVVYFKDQHLLPDGSVIDRPFPTDWNFNGLSPVEQLEKMVSTDTFLGSPCMKAIRVSFLRDHNIKFPCGLWAEDILWDMELSAALPKNRMLDEYCYVVRLTEGSRSKQTSETHLAEYLQIIDRGMSIPSDDAQVRYAIKSYVAYHYVILCALVAKTDGIKGTSLYKSIADKKELLNYRLNKKVRLARGLCQCIGIRGTMWVLGRYLKYRG